MSEAKRRKFHTILPNLVYPAATDVVAISSLIHKDKSHILQARKKGVLVPHLISWLEAHMDYKNRITDIEQLNRAIEPFRPISNCCDHLV